LKLFSPYFLDAQWFAGDIWLLWLKLGLSEELI
jgi:hypothetical protein